MKYATSFVTAAVLVLSGSGVSGIVLPPGATPVHPPDGIEILKERIVLPPGATPIRHPDGTEVLKKRIVLPPGATPVHPIDGTEILKERELLRPGETVIHPPPGAVIARQADIRVSGEPNIPVATPEPLVTGHAHIPIPEILNDNAKRTIGDDGIPGLLGVPAASVLSEDPNLIYGRAIPGAATAVPFPDGPFTDVLLDKRRIPEAVTAFPAGVPGYLNVNDKRRIPAAIPTSFQTVPVALPSNEPIIPLKPGTDIPIAGKKRMLIGGNAVTGESFQQEAEQQQQQQQQKSDSVLIPDLPGEPKTALRRRSGSIELPDEIVPEIPGEPKAALKQRYVLPSGATAVPIPHPSGLHIVALAGEDGAQ